MSRLTKIWIEVEKYHEEGFCYRIGSPAGIGNNFSKAETLTKVEHLLGICESVAEDEYKKSKQEKEK